MSNPLPNPAADRPIQGSVLPELDVIIPNLHWRYSGVTATNRMIAPRIAGLLPAAWLGSDAPEGIARLSFRDLLRLWRRQKPLVWHARRNNEMMAGLLLRALGWPLTLVFTSAAQRHHTWTTRAMMTRMDAVIATSEASASYLKVPHTIIMHGIDTERYAPAPDRDAEFAQTGLPGRYGIGCFGRVRAQKGTDVFVKAMCRLLPHYPDFTAVIVGEVTPDQRGFEAKLKAQVNAAGLSQRIRFLGELPIDEVPLWYRRILIYAFTSRNEGFGLTLLEAMASANALVAARAGAAEKVVRDGDTGILVPTGDADALAKALEPLMREPAQAAAMGRRARERVVAEFGANAEAAKIVAFYRRVLAARH
ncbi:MAG: glycosyltransferase family 4 protein [Pseudorhodoplanes sp.]|jgi:mannosyltransferase|nr:glycosyltransferase family 4 protein [Pseudorhodoplanes sp.]